MIPLFNPYPMNDTEISATVSALMVGLGAFLKSHTPLRNEWIPSILLVIAIVATLGLTNGWLSFEAWIKAIGAGLAAVGLHSGTVATREALKARSITEP